MHHRLLIVLMLLIGSQPPAHALELMLPQVYEEGMDVSGWLMSEKLDGVRGFWDGTQLLSKKGNPFYPPSEFVKNFPDFEIEGEIWGGRECFEKTVSTVKRNLPHAGWFDLKYAIFDVPGAQGDINARLKVAEKWFSDHPSKYAYVIQHVPVSNGAHLRGELARVEALGGEGLILRRPGASYIKGRSRNVLKVKSYHDMEAVVIGHTDGTGRNEGRMGALMVKLPGNPISFRIGTGFSDKERQHPPPIGSLITFKHYGFYKSGIPKFPSFLRIREKY